MAITIPQHSRVISLQIKSGEEAASRHSNFKEISTIILRITTIIISFHKIDQLINLSIIQLITFRLTHLHQIKGAKLVIIILLVVSQIAITNLTNLLIIIVLVVVGIFKIALLMLTDQINLGLMIKTKSQIIPSCQMLMQIMVGVDLTAIVIIIVTTLQIVIKHLPIAIISFLWVKHQAIITTNPILTVMIMMICLATIVSFSKQKEHE